MRTNIEIDDTLMAKAQKLSNIKTKKLIVEKALQLYVVYYGDSDHPVSGQIDPGVS